MYFYFNSTGWKSVPNWCPDRRTSNSSWLKIYFQKCCFRTSFLPSHHTHHHRRRRRRQWNKILFYLSIKQCDQMVRLFVQYLSIYIIKIFATVGSKFCQILCKLSKNDLKFAKVAKYLQIWSHWYQVKREFENISSKLYFERNLYWNWFFYHALPNSVTR